MATRITQALVESLAEADAPPVVTSLVLEVLGEEGVPVYLSQLAVEALAEDAAPTDVTQLLLEALTDDQAPILLTQVMRCITTFVGTAVDESATQSVVDAEEVTGTTTIDSAGVRYETVWLRHPERADELRGMLVVPTGSTRMTALTRDLQRALCERLVQLG